MSVNTPPTPVPDYYVPGTCNIDIAGRRFRKRLAVSVGVVGFCVLILMFVLRAPVVVRYAITTGFAFGTIINYLEMRKSFCVTNAIRGTFETKGKMIRLPDLGTKMLDRRSAKSILVTSFLLALVIGLVALLPLG